MSRSESRPRIELTRGELRARVASLRAALRDLGVGPGDRVAAYLPNIPEAMITLYAAASLGAIFTCCAPESGTRSVISRIGQVEPSVLVTVDGYVYGGQRYDRTAEVAAIRAAVPSIRATIAVPYLEPLNAVPDSLDWNELMARPADLEFTPVPFAHPLYIVYSSGTTGSPRRSSTVTAASCWNTSNCSCCTMTWGRPTAGSGTPPPIGWRGTTARQSCWAGVRC